MSRVRIKPMPRSFLTIPELYRPGIPPMFPGCPDGGPSDADKELAFKLFQALDPESQRWYLKHSRTLRDMFENSKKSKVRPKGEAKGCVNTQQQTDNIEKI